MKFHQLYWLFVLGVILVGLIAWIAQQSVKVSRSVQPAILQFHSPGTATSVNPRAIRWSIEGERLQEIRARVIVYQNGSPNGVMEKKISFTARSDRITGELLLVLRDGGVFGQPNRFSPWIGLSIDQRISFGSVEGDGMKAYTRPDPLQSSGNSVQFDGTIDGSCVLYWESLGGWSHQTIHASSLEADLKRESSEGRIAYAVLLECE